MTEATEGRKDGRPMAIRAAVLTLGLLSVLPSFRRLSAQVGHDPSHSPYHDIRRGTGPRLVFGYLGGERGTVPVSMTNGVTFGARYEAWMGKSISFTAGLAYAQTTRYIVDPFLNDSVRKSGPIDNDVILADLGLQLSLTGSKTFHGFAPYVGTSLGLAFGSRLPADTSGYQFGTRFTFTPGAGLRWYPASRINVQADARLVFWKLRYPINYKTPLSPDGTTVLPLFAKETDWTIHPWVSLGVGWTF